MNNPKTAEMYWSNWTLVDHGFTTSSPADGECDSNPTSRADFQRSPHVEHLNPQQFFTAIRCTEIEGSLMNDPDISPHRKVFFWGGSIFTDQDPITRHDPAILRCRTDLTSRSPRGAVVHGSTEGRGPVPSVHPLCQCTGPYASPCIGR
jgi:hypothetical protein